MEFNQKLQQLRKQMNLTQEELAQKLFVSRTAISKWESGRGYPSIDSLREISSFFNISIDELLSSDELLTVAEEDNAQRVSGFSDLVFGLLDCSVAIFFFVPLFGQNANAIIQAVSLLSLSEISPWLMVSYFVIVIAMILSGILTLALQKYEFKIHKRIKSMISFILNILGVILFVVSSQPYASVVLFVFLLIKILVLRKSR